MRIIFLFVASFLMMTMSFSQGTYSPPKISEKIRKQFDDAVLGSKAGHIEEAILTLNQIIDRVPSWIEPRQELSRIYYEAGRKKEAVQMLESALALDSVSQLKQLYTLGRLYEETSQHDKAVAAYTCYMRKSKTDDPLRYKSKEALELFEARQKMMQRKYEIHVAPLPAEINTTDHEAVGRWSLDGKELIFERMVEGQEDLFFARIDSATQKWKILPFEFNTSDNEGAPAISPDGKYLVFTSCDKRDGLGGCDLYISVNKNNKWTRPVNMGPGFNSQSWDGQPCFGLDGTTLYFSSNRAGGFGGRDIWYMYQTSPDSWSKPVSAGPGINTANNEGSPFIYYDGNAMYFMRDGKEGFGANDLYISRKGIDAKWQTAENMSTPINSAEDEGALAVHPDGKHALITRVTPAGKNDLFEFELPADFISIPQQQLQVLMLDKITGLPIRAQLEIFEPKGKPETRMSQWSNEAGRLITTVNRNTPYGIIATTTGYLMYSTNLEADSSSARTLEVRMIPMAKVENEAVVMQNVFFETGSSELLPASEPEMQKLLYTLRTNQSMIIEIRGHTDNVGDDASNQQLSEARAKAVYQYLLAKGVAITRISYKGFGETQPIADNETISGRQKNRRTEFYIVRK